MGAKKNTIQNLQVLEIDNKNKLLIVKGSIPGARNSIVYLFPNAKSKISIIPNPVDEEIFIQNRI